MKAPKELWVVVSQEGWYVAAFACRATAEDLVRQRTEGGRGKHCVVRYVRAPAKKAAEAKARRVK